MDVASEFCFLGEIPMIMNKVGVSQEEERVSMGRNGRAVKARHTLIGEETHTVALVKVCAHPVLSIGKSSRTENRAKVPEESSPPFAPSNITPRTSSPGGPAEPCTIYISP